MADAISVQRNGEKCQNRNFRRKTPGLLEISILNWLKNDPWNGHRSIPTVHIFRQPYLLQSNFFVKLPPPTPNHASLDSYCLDEGGSDSCKDIKGIKMEKRVVSTRNTTVNHICPIRRHHAESPSRKIRNYLVRQKVILLFSS